MSTPLYHALHRLADKQTVRFHMPGHKGKPVLSAFSSILPLDFTETYETGNLYTAQGPIRLAEQKAARFYQADDCHFLTGGSSQGIHAMLYAAAGAGSHILLDRNCHKAAANAAALLDLTPHFVSPSVIEPFGIPGVLDPAQIARTLAEHPEIRAVFITSPNYYGVCQDIPAISKICHAHSVPLLVDAAHGAHFPAIGRDSPIAQGANLATLSAHKTLYALGQSAMLLSDGSICSDALRYGAALFGTSSPSYILLASLDLARQSLEHDDSYLQTAHRTAQLRDFVQAHTCFLPLNAADMDPCRLTISAVGTDWSGNDLSDLLYERFQIACEMSDARNVVCIVTPADLSENLLRLQTALQTLSSEHTPAPLPAPLPPLPHPHAVHPVRSALLGAFHTLPLAHIHSGMVCARPVTPYPPGVPVLWPGEEITMEHIVFLRNQCYNTVDRIAVIPDEMESSPCGQRRPFP